MDRNNRKTEKNVSVTGRKKTRKQENVLESVLYIKMEIFNVYNDKI